MLLIEQVSEKNEIKSDYVKCPTCKRGRLCDKAIGDKVSVTAIDTDHSNWTSTKIILKCPKCSNRFYLHITKE